jgi:2-dehydro-3-deoxyphosphogluconate aldolase/(4S)-4-hydroxy-2-oxoglutarate aldolase
MSLPFKSRIVPVIEMAELADALPLADALLAGGIDVIEITLRTPVALEAMALLCKERPQLSVAAGTVMGKTQLDAAYAAGVRLAFSPGSTVELLTAAKNSGVHFFPGVVTPSEIMQSLSFGFTTMKLFPADAIQSVKLLKSIAGPFPHARFIPTGGINDTNIHEYAVQSNVLAMGASAVAPKDLVRNKQWEQISERARRLLEMTRTAA